MAEFDKQTSDQIYFIACGLVSIEWIIFIGGESSQADDRGKSQFGVIKAVINIKIKVNEYRKIFKSKQTDASNYLCNLANTSETCFLILKF